MRVALLCLLFSLASFGSLVTSASLPSTCKGQQNLQPIIEYSTKTAMPIASVANGTLASVLPYGSTTPLLVLHVYGDSYSMGEAYGQLLQKEIDTLIPQAYAYFASTYKLPTWLVNGVLDLTRNTTKAFTPQHHFDFMQGVADGVAAAGGVSTYLDIWRIAMIPEAIKATCSIVGAWGPATADGGLLQLRALDWGTDGPFQQWPLLTTFHPNDGSFTYTNLGWAGLYATITGFSSSNLAVSEKVWYDYKGLDNIIGYPWTFMLQDIMRFDKDIDEALSRIGGAARTCAIWVGLGQGARPNPRNTNVTLPADFKLVGDSFQQLHIFNPENFPTYQGHDYFPNLLFVNKHVQPSGDACFNDLFHQSYGQLTPDTFIQSVTAGDQTGDMHIAVMDFDAKTMYIANAAPMPNNTPAYQNGFVQFDMEALWSTPQP